MYNYQDDEVTELRKEIEQLKTGNRLHLELAEIKEGEIERLQEENQRQREHIMLLYSLVQTEHEIIRVAALKEKE